MFLNNLFTRVVSPLGLTFKFRRKQTNFGQLLLRCINLLRYIAYARFQASAVVYLSSSLFLDVTQRMWYLFTDVSGQPVFFIFRG